VKNLFFLIAAVIGLSAPSMAVSLKADKELIQKKQMAVRLVKAASTQKKSTVVVEDVYRSHGKIVVKLSESYETSESGVTCFKTVEFGKDKEDNRFQIIRILDGMCFS
jgi:hypothetical protein